MPRVAQGDYAAYDEALSLLNETAPDPDLPKPWRISFCAKKRDLADKLAAAWANGPGGGP